MPASGPCGRCGSSGPRWSTRSSRCPTGRSRRCSTRPSRSATGTTPRATSSGTSPRKSSPSWSIHYQRVPTPGSIVVIQQPGNAANRVDPAATAFSHRHARYELTILAGWTDPADDERCIRWVRELYDATEPFGLGHYVNSLVDDDQSVASAYQPEGFSRLQALKAKYDPGNFFRLNPNIPPSA